MGRCDFVQTPTKLTNRVAQAVLMTMCSFGLRRLRTHGQRDSSLVISAFLPKMQVRLPSCPTQWYLVGNLLMSANFVTKLSECTSGNCIVVTASQERQHQEARHTEADHLFSACNEEFV